VWEIAGSSVSSLEVDPAWWKISSGSPPAGTTNSLAVNKLLVGGPGASRSLGSGGGRGELEKGGGGNICSEEVDWWILPTEPLINQVE
jgi:hypothetical protein